MEYGDFVVYKICIMEKYTYDEKQEHKSKEKVTSKGNWGTKQQQQTIMAEHTKNKTELRATDPSIAIDRPIESKSEPDGILSAFL